MLSGRTGSIESFEHCPLLSYMSGRRQAVPGTPLAPLIEADYSGLTATQTQPDELFFSAEGLRIGKVNPELYRDYEYLQRLQSVCMLCAAHVGMYFTTRKGETGYDQSGMVVKAA